MTRTEPPATLATTLDHTPQPLQFGTSGRRGRVIDLSQLEIYLNARAELDYLLSLPPAAGGIAPGTAFFLAHDLRPSSLGRVPDQGNRGELVQAIVQAVRDAGLVPVNLGAIPTPALCVHALARRSGSIMVTGSHIPFDRNGYKTNSGIGELSKEDEAPIEARAAAWRTVLMSAPAERSRFDASGMLREPPALPPADQAGAHGYLARYRDFFGPQSLAGLRILVYQHSAVGRDLLVEALRALGAEVVAAGRSETFIPIDTEAVDDETLASLTALATAAVGGGKPFDALVSTDGDSDRPLLVGLSPCRDGALAARFFGGDLVGMVVAAALGADAVVVPVSCNDAIDSGPLAGVLRPRTRIGSPYVIAGMRQAVADGCARVCGFEANGGFLTASPITRKGRTLAPLPTRDAFLPIFTVLTEMRDRRVPMAALFDALPRRFSRAGVLRDFPRARSLRLLDALAAGRPGASPESLADFFRAQDGFGRMETVDRTDGLRIRFDNGDVAHIRPSGNADELRLYAVADTQARADAILRLGLQAQDGILPRLASAFT